MTSISLTGKTALITGAATGIGRAMALAFGRAGARVALNHLGRADEARKLLTEITATGASAIGIEADITRSIEIERMIHLINEALGPIDILVNNAGVLLEKSFLETTEEDWDYVVDTDLKGVFLCSKAVLPGMVKRGSGSVISVASELGVIGRAKYGPYCAAKAGVIGLTRSMAREFAPAIRVNAIAPGPVNTPMLSLENMSPEMLKRERDIPAQRVGEPEEIADTALFLASDLASFYFGQVLSPNGGAWMG